ncbi:TetR family transcriptional regulator [Oceanicola sp. 22II-s10i]|uniref:TetR/AcrR family transcriptional regulator n=1 Tax=Oceanicola sp. 22II-s10i TaxID=1317116 RepID=UPI000B5260A5|nr:TetR/AcrR family transcriptional regulator [Oceanicola sp. 22II-s10i]OWU82933.1 TetR family transcriptional regulator [Oceanicola sp. 22II-s10i]
MARTTGSRASETGPRIRAAALRLFAQHGYAAVSMRQIAGEVGLQVGALYNYTPDKQSLLFDLMQGHMTELLSALDAVAMPVEPGAALDAFVRFHIRYHAERPDEVFIAYMELRNLTDENFEQVETLRRSYESRLQAVLEHGAAAGVFAVPDARIATLALIAMLTGVNTWFRRQGRLSLDEIESIYCGMARKAVGA